MKNWQAGSGNCIRFAICSNSHRTTAFCEALEKARDRFAQERGLSIAGQHDVKATYRKREVALQAVDYYLWALQRVFEKREDRFLELLWPQGSLVVDVGDTHEKYFSALHPDAGLQGVRAESLPIKSPGGEKTEAALAAIDRQVSTFRVADVQAECPGVGVDLIRPLLARLRKEEKIKSLGTGRGAKWEKSGTR